MKLTTESIQKAMTCPYPAKGDEFYLDPKGENAQIIDEATRRGYIRRYSTTQVEWTEEGLAKARREIGTPKEKLAEVLRVMREEYPEDAVPRVLPILKEIEEAL